MKNLGLGWRLSVFKQGKKIHRSDNHSSKRDAIKKALNDFDFDFAQVTSNSSGKSTMLTKDDALRIINIETKPHKNGIVNAIKNAHKDYKNGKKLRSAGIVNNPIKHKNPAILKTALKVDQAKQLRAGFRATAGGAAGQTGKIKTVARRKADNVQMVVGIIDCIEYTVLDDQGRRIKGQSFRHEFSGKSCPLLTCSHDGKQLYFMGGSYRFKTDGINDI